MITDEYSPRITEAEQVEAWRLHTLIQSGFPVAIADRVAAAGDVDLHYAVELLANGCTPELVAAILL